MSNFEKIKKFLGTTILLLIVLSPFVFTKKGETTEKQKPLSFTPIKQTTPTPTPYKFPYKLPEIPQDRSYRLMLVGDSMVEVLGPNADLIRRKLIEKYPENEFVIYNYGQGSTNILSLPERLTEVTKFKETEYVPILKQGFEIIIIESFAYNPLSEYPLEEGLKKQTETLEQSVRMILKEKPNIALLFMTPIAPHPTLFARNEYKLTLEERKQWVEERISYIDNHRKFAEERGIPVIDVYKASLNKDGTVNRSYIAEDYIHPSLKGMDLISRTIADFIYNQKLFE